MCGEIYVHDRRGERRRGRPREDRPRKPRGRIGPHIALKLLAYLLFRAETGGVPLRIEQGVGQRHKPDLVATEPDTGRVLLWIDCGQIETKRLGRIAAQNARARVVVVKATVAEVDAYALAAERFLPPADRGAADVAFLGFDPGFVSGFCALLRGTNVIGLTRGREGIEVRLNGETRATGVHRRPARPTTLPAP
jgi:hypothetical protein